MGFYESECFENRAEAADLYWKNRDLVMSWAGDGHRPLPYWDFEIGERPQKGESDLACLRRLGLPMSEKEGRMLEQEDAKKKRFEGDRRSKTAERVTGDTESSN